MKTHFQLRDIEKVQASLTITMPLGEWRVLRAQIAKDKWPSCSFSSAIYDMIRKAEEHFYEESED